MVNNQIINGIGQGFKQLGVETAEKLVEETGKILEPIITAQELLGDITPMSDQELAQKQQQEEIKKQQEINKLRSEMGQGRKVEDEMTQLHRQQEEQEEKKEEYYERERQQRERERQIQEQNMNMDLLAPKKHHKDKGGNKHKTQQPDPSQMSQTQEFNKGGKID